MYKVVAFLLIILSVSLIAQNVTVVETVKLPIGIEHSPSYPKFAPDDAKIIFTSENYKGLYTHDIMTGKIEIISEGNGAGYNPRILNDENIYYKTFNLSNSRKIYSINKYNRKSGNVELIESNIRYAKIPFQLSWEVIYYQNNSSLDEQPMFTAPSKNGGINLAVYSENDDLIIYNGNEKSVLNPLGKGVYVWESISGDGEFILFSFGARGAFVTDLNGEIILNVEEAHYPRFSPNGQYISYMKDKDDGHRYTESDIYIYSLADDKSYQITDTDSRIEMHAEWSYRGNKLVYHTTDGEIYITELEFEN